MNPPKEKPKFFLKPTGDFKLPYAFIRSLPHPEALLLAYIIEVQANFVDDKRNYTNHYERIKEGWCPFPMKKIMRELYMNRTKQSSLVSSLEEKGLLSIEMVGLPPMRWVKVNGKEIYKYMTSMDKGGKK